MPITFTRASTTTVVEGNSTTNNLRDITAGTIVSLCYVTGPYPDGTGVRMIWSSNDNGTRNRTLTYGPNAGVDAIRFQIPRATTSLVASVSSTNLPFAAADKWCWWAATWNTAGAAGTQLLYGGDLWNPMQVVTTYVAQTAGSGATTEGSNEFALGGSAASSQGFPGQIELVAVWNKYLTIGELRAFQQNPSPKLYSPLGYWRLNTGGISVLDATGNGNNANVQVAVPAPNPVIQIPPFTYPRSHLSVPRLRTVA